MSIESPNSINFAVSDLLSANNHLQSMNTYTEPDCGMLSNLI